MENTAPKKKHIFLKIIAVIAAVLLVVFIILRCTHVIVRVSNKYTTRFDTMAHINHGEENKDVAEMVYMKRLEGLEIRSTNVTDFSFRVEF